MLRRYYRESQGGHVDGRYGLGGGTGVFRPCWPPGLGSGGVYPNSFRSRISLNSLGNGVTKLTF